MKRVKVTTQSIEDTSYPITISDNGAGSSRRNKRKKIFQPFFHDNLRRTETGLGLAYHMTSCRDTTVQLDFKAA
jgi:signal transduction histidine kinase